MSKKEKIILFGSIAAIILISAAIILIVKLTRNSDSAGISAENETSTAADVTEAPSTEEPTETTADITEASTEPVTDNTTEASTDPGTENTETVQVNTEKGGIEKQVVQQPPKTEEVQLLTNILSTESDTLDANYRSEGGVCATADANGDGQEDLVMLPQIDEYGTANLYIYGYDNGTYKVLYEAPGFLPAAGGGVRFTLFTRESNGMLYMYISYGDETSTYEWLRFDVQADGTLKTTSLASRSIGPGGESYTYKGKEGTKKQYDNTAMVLGKDVRAMVLYNDLADNWFFDTTHYVPLWGKQYYQLSEQLSWEQAVAAAPVAELPDGIPQTFWLTNGSDYWGGNACINKDGTFTGSYHMEEFMEGSDEYGTKYKGEISGSFQEVRKIDDYTYALIVGESSEGFYDMKPAEEGHLTVEPTRTRGLGGGRIYLLFLPGHPMDTLPEDFLYWCFDANERYEEREKSELSIWGLYNLDTNYGFHE